MKKHQLCCIGHITLDKVVTAQFENLGELVKNTIFVA